MLIEVIKKKRNEHLRIFFFTDQSSKGAKILQRAQNAFKFVSGARATGRKR